jgi:uncharacterized protein
VKTGDVVKVRVVEVDLQRQRIALTMKLDAPARPAGGDNNFQATGRDQRARGGSRQPATPTGGAMAAAFAKLQKR